MTRRADQPTSRRGFLRAGLALALVPRGIMLPVQDSLPGRGALGTLRDPSAVGRPL